MSTGVSGRRGWKGALTALLAAALMFTGVGVANADPTPGAGSVSGTVTRASDGQPAAGVSVHVVLQDFSAGESATTASDGTFSVDGLAPGTYLVSFAQGSSDYVMQWWGGTRTSAASTPVEVVADQAVTGVDVALVSAGSISGTVTRAADGSPLAGIQVSASSLANGQYLATTDDAGTYLLSGMAPGAYQLRFTDPAGLLLPQYRQAAVQADYGTTGMDAALAAGATISGHVLAASDGSPVSGSVTASGSAGWFSASIESDGSYSLQVAEGTYAVQFRPYGESLLTEYWQNAATIADATPVTVSSGHDATGVDADLDQALFIRGTISLDGVPGLGSGPEPSIAIVASAGGKQVGMGYAHQDGSYSIKVRAGTYTLVAQGAELQEHTYARQYYSHATSEAESTPVVLGASDVTGIDFDLASIPAVVSLSSTAARPGDTLTVSGSGFVPGEPVSIVLHSTPVELASVKADESGAVVTTVTLPTDTAAGTHEITLTGAYSFVAGSVSLTVPGPGGPATDPGNAGQGSGSTPASASGSGTAQLAATGAEIPSAALLGGALMLLLGLAVIRIRRRA